MLAATRNDKLSALMSRISFAVKEFDKTSVAH